MFARDHTPHCVISHHFALGGLIGHVASQSGLREQVPCDPKSVDFFFIPLEIVTEGIEKASKRSKMPPKPMFR